MATSTKLAQLRLLQLSSMSLPVGGYAFSQGLEYAVETGWLHDVNSTEQWLALQLRYGLAKLDAAVMLLQYTAIEENDTTELSYWNDYLLASRETSELKLGDTAMGLALARLLKSLAVPIPQYQHYSFTSLFTVAAQHWGISPSDCVTGFCWAWLENQVAAATKLVPLGQTQAQQLLGRLQALIPSVFEAANATAVDDIGASLPALAIASSLHETQYSRLFRS